MAIANNKKAFHDFFIEDRIEAGLVLEGWEVKAIRAARVQLKESYIYWKKDAFYLVGCHITALPTASTHIKPDAVRPRKLLLKQSEINKLIGKPNVQVTPSCRWICIFHAEKSRWKSVWQKVRNSTINDKV